MSNPPSDDDVNHQRVAAMLRHLGLAPDGRPRVGMPGALLRKPVTSPRYESDLIQAQRAMQDERPQPVRARPTEAKKVEPAYKSTTLPRYVYPDDAARKIEAERDAAEARSKSLPICAQDFLRDRISADPSQIRLYDGGGGIPNLVGSHVTYGNAVHLTGTTFDRNDEPAMRDKFHEIGHVDQNARMNLNSFDHFAAYLPFLGHDGSPLEQQAEDGFAKRMYDEYKDLGLDRSCRF